MLFVRCQSFDNLHFFLLQFQVNICCIFTYFLNCTGTFSDVNLLNLFSADVCTCLTEKDFIGLDKSGQRVLLLSAESDMDKLTMRLSQLRRCAVCITYIYMYCIKLNFLRISYKQLINML